MLLARHVLFCTAGRCRCYRERTYKRRRGRKNGREGARAYCLESSILRIRAISHHLSVCIPLHPNNPLYTTLLYSPCVNESPQSYSAAHPSIPILCICCAYCTTTYHRTNKYHHGCGCGCQEIAIIRSPLSGKSQKFSYHSTHKREHGYVAASRAEAEPGPATVWAL